MKREQSPLFEIILRLFRRWNIPDKEAQITYDAITDEVFYKEMALRQENPSSFTYPEILKKFFPMAEEETYKWEYTGLDLQVNIIPKKELDKWGDDGWELVTVENGIAYFKRRVK